MKKKPGLTRGIFYPVFFLLCFSAFSPQEEIREHYEKGISLLSENRAEEALVELDKARELAPEMPFIYNAIGLAHLQLEASAHDAIEAFEEAVRLKPDFPDPYNSLGILYSGAVEDFEMAEQYFRKAIELKPDFSRAYFGLGWMTFIKKKDPENAIKYLEKAAELAPDHAESQYYLGMAYILAGKKPQAIKPISILRMSGHDQLSAALASMMEEETTVARSVLLEGRSAPAEQAPVQAGLAPGDNG